MTPVVLLTRELSAVLALPQGRQELRMVVVAAVLSQCGCELCVSGECFPHYTGTTRACGHTGTSTDPTAHVLSV